MLVWANGCRKWCSTSSSWVDSVQAAHRLPFSGAVSSVYTDIHVSGVHVYGPSLERNTCCSRLKGASLDRNEVSCLSLFVVDFMLLRSLERANQFRPGYELFETQGRWIELLFISASSGRGTLLSTASLSTSWAFISASLEGIIHNHDA